MSDPNDPTVDQNQPLDGGYTGPGVYDELVYWLGRLIDEAKSGGLMGEDIQRILTRYLLIEQDLARKFTDDD